MRRPVLFALLSVAVAAGLGLLAHRVLGWPWVLGAAVVAGLVAPSRAGLVGAAALAAVGVALSWGGLLFWNHARYDAPVLRMTEAMGTILGGLPPVAVPLLSLAVGVVLGVLGGVVGASLRRAVRPERPARSVPSAPRPAAPGPPTAAPDPSR